MKVVRSIPVLREVLGAERAAARSIGFVPTMGALHEGHLSLVALARASTDVVVMSIFVNPLQFGPNEDLDRYPRPEERDLELAEGAGVDVAFLPTVGDMYPQGRVTTVSVSGISDVLEGASRPGHFDGVATVVAKLFNLVRPDRAFFGQKDAQQVAVVKQMVRDLDFPLEVVVGETIREPDGLALSSRNAYLGSEDRARAMALYRALEAGAAVLRAGERPADAERAMLDVLASVEGIEVGYAVAADPDTFEPAGHGDVLLAVAARLGFTRLIDNLIVKASERGTA